MEGVGDRQNVVDEDRELADEEEEEEDEEDGVPDGMSNSGSTTCEGVASSFGDFVQLASLSADLKSL